MNTIQELSDFVKENDIKFIRLSFIDLDGRQKNLSVMAEGLENVVKNGVVFDGAVSGFNKKAGGDLRLFPDISTIHILPWRPQHGRVARFLCSIKDVNGKNVDFDTRNILQKTLTELKSLDISCDLGTDSEFYLFKTDEEGNPTKKTHDNAGYFDIAPLDKGENVRREICLCLEEMGIQPLSSHHEKGPGQNEINFIRTHALEACDNYAIFKSVVKAIASRNGLFASFMPKPLEKESGNGLAVNIELMKNRKSLFDSGELTSEADSFIAGVLNRAAETALFFNSLPNSYERLGKFDAPDKIEFSMSDRCKFMRFAYKYNTKRLEFRSPDNACNLYLVTALMLKTGIEGIKRGEKISSFTPSAMPKSIEEAIEAAENSAFLTAFLGKTFVDDYIAGKKADASNYREDKAQANQIAFERI